ncbi:metallophosphoesterase [Bacillus sp. FJAT-27231]|uniref:metallophosphoesterase n=1 Tax=Bacillus sp. FJAT-27231 TaxID=1679168 RepID=UPI0006716EF1|nr:metallophosphoesterase [Bacillus sp. FJAT-27231]
MMLYLAIAFLFLVSLVVFMWREAQRNEVLADVLAFPHYPWQKPLTLFFISDIHRRAIHPSIIEQVKGRTDLVIIGGDLAEKGVPLERISRNLESLKQVAPVFFVWGNNDYEIPAAELLQLFQEQGIHVLRNDSFCLSADVTDGSSVYLIGVDDVSKGNSCKTSAFKEVRNESFKILISHNPIFRNKLTAADDVSLFLSGHTHGGQIRFLGFGPYKKGGWERQGKMEVLVSNGYGTSGVPLRLGAKAETHLITIKKE